MLWRCLFDVLAMYGLAMFWQWSEDQCILIVTQLGIRLASFHCPQAETRSTRGAHQRRGRVAVAVHRCFVFDFNSPVYRLCAFRGEFVLTRLFSHISYLRSRAAASGLGPNRRRAERLKRQPTRLGPMPSMQVPPVEETMPHVHIYIYIYIYK